MEVGCFEKVVEALRLVKEQAKEVGLESIVCPLLLSVYKYHCIPLHLYLCTEEVGHQCISLWHVQSLHGSNGTVCGYKGGL